MRETGGKWLVMQSLDTRQGHVSEKRQQLEAVNFQLLRFRDPHFGQELHDVIPLIALQLNHFTILLVLHYRPVACELL